jgi:hypothetical protein
MIFGSNKNKSLANDISNATRQTVSLVESQHGVPAGFWQDSYVLGFLMGQINAFMSVFGGDGLSVADKGRVVVECLGELSGMKGKGISEQSMVFASNEDPDFMRANQNGMFIAMVQAEKLPDAANNPVVAATRQQLDQAGEGTSMADVAQHLTKHHWVGEVRTRLSV